MVRIKKELSMPNILNLSGSGHAPAIFLKTDAQIEFQSTFSSKNMHVFESFQQCILTCVIYFYVSHKQHCLHEFLMLVTIVDLMLLRRYCASQ